MATVGRDHLNLVVVTPQGEVVHCNVSEITVPGLLGDFGVLPGHIPFLSALRPGVLTYMEGRHQHILAVGEGYVEVGLRENVIVLTERVAAPEAIDLEEVTREEEEALAQLARLSPEEHAAEYRAAQAMSAWARARKEAVLRARAGA